MRARAIFVATGIFRPADSGRTEYVLEPPQDDVGRCFGAVEQRRHIGHEGAGLDEALYEIPAGLAVLAMRDREHQRVGGLHRLERREREAVLLMQEITVGLGVVELYGDAEVLELAHDVDDARVADVGRSEE